MKLSTSSRYGLRALVDLVANYDGSPVALCTIAARQQISESYLEQTFAILRRAGFVRSVRGAQGGYSPAIDPATTSAATVLRTLEGSLSIAEDAAATRGGDDPVQRCIRQCLWNKVDEAVERTLSVTLSDLAREHMRMRGNAQIYEI